MRRTATGGVIALVALAGCTEDEPAPPDAAPDPPPRTSVYAEWRVRCPGGTCDYPAHEYDHSLPRMPTVDDLRYAACEVLWNPNPPSEITLAVGQMPYTSPTETIPGFSLGVRLGYAPMPSVPGHEAIDVSMLCEINVTELDGRQWGGACSTAPPTPAVPCQVVSALSPLNGVSLAFSCSGMPRIPAQPGDEADLASADDPATPISILMFGCDYNDE